MYRFQNVIESGQIYSCHSAVARAHGGIHPCGQTIGKGIAKMCVVLSILRCFSMFVFFELNYACNGLMSISIIGYFKAKLKFSFGN